MRSRALWIILAVLLAIFLILVLVFRAHAYDVRPWGVVVYVSYLEPTTLTDGSALTDLTQTTVYWCYDDSCSPTKSEDIPATRARGGGTIATTVTVPMVTNQTRTVRVEVTATSASLGVSLPGTAGVIVIRAAPGAPTNPGFGQ